MPDEGVRVLLVDDDEDDFVIARDLLAAIPGQFLLDWESNFETALTASRKSSHDILLLDYRLSDRDGLDFLRRLREGGSTLPVIFLTGAADREIDMQAMRAGATDFLAKDGLSSEMLDRAIRYALSMSELNQRLLDEHQRLLRSDKLSDLPPIS